MTKLEFNCIYIYKGVFPEFGMQLFSLCHEARMYGATLPHSKALCLALLSPSGEVLKIRPFLDKVKESIIDRRICIETCHSKRVS